MDFVAASFELARLFSASLKLAATYEMTFPGEVRIDRLPDVDQCLQAASFVDCHSQESRSVMPKGVCETVRNELPQIRPGT